MAGSARSSSAVGTHAYRMFAPSRCPGSPGAAADEFDESEVWGPIGLATAGGGAEFSVVSSVELHQAAAAARARPIPTASRKKKNQADGGRGSVPMNVPDWQKILGVEYRDHQQHAGEWVLHEDDDDDDYGRGAAAAAIMVPPHELAWRSRAASLSVHEGVGRTLKGRDLSRVRDAVWKKTGFED